MKKTVFFLAVLFVAGIFSAKAQSASDSAFVRDLNYTFINTSSLPVTVSGDLALTSGGKILKDIRPGKRAKGYAFTLNTTKYLNIFLSESGTSWDEYLFLLDSNYNEITHNDDANGGGSRIITNLTPGNYYIIATEYSYYSSSQAYDLSIDDIVITPLNQLTYTPITIPDTLTDTFHASYPNVWYNGYCYKAKGYSFQGTQNNYLRVIDDYWDALYVLMDNNWNVIQSGYSIFTPLPRTGTYYLAILDQETYYCNTYISTFSIQNMPTVYIDGVNGSDSRNGLTPQTALLTLDTAIARTGGIGKYYITDDYTFQNDYSLEVLYAEIYPYQKDIRLKIASDGAQDILHALPGHLVFGEQGSNYYFILDSCGNKYYDDFLDADASGSILEVNNLKVRNTHFPSEVFYGDSIVLRNCEFTNDTFGSSFIVTVADTRNSLKLTNCNISQNLFYSNFLYQYYDAVQFTMENTTIAGNTFDEYNPVYFWENAQINLTSGSWRNNNLTDNYYYNGNPNLSTQNSAGIWSFNSTINIGAGFTMDANNYICIDSASTLNIAENLTSSLVAQIYPMKWDDNSGYYEADYYEGRPVLWGSSSLLRANYNKFSIAQADNASLWYLHSDGKIYTTEEQIGIAQAEGADISIYPNPASDKVTIDLRNTAANEICVMDIYGKTVVRQAVSAQSQVLDLGNLAKGMYFVQIRNNGKVEATQKLVKK